MILSWSTAAGRARGVSLGLGALLLLAACGHESGGGKPMASMPMGEPTLYERLGGQPAITAVVDTFVANVAADDRINQRFAGTDIPHLKTLLVEQVCAATGGPCTYTGRDMRSTHAGMNITDAEFNDLVGDLVAALDTYKVPPREKDELLTALGGMKKDIVGI